MIIIEILVIEGGNAVPEQKIYGISCGAAARTMQQLG